MLPVLSRGIDGKPAGAAGGVAETAAAGHVQASTPLGEPAGKAAGPEALPCPWPAWQVFAARFVQPDGRVLDPSSPRAHTVSEGQAYALFFALVQGDRAAFERILRWTEDNLAAGDLALRLPAWQWGRRDDNTYGVLDANSASDADLWLAYSLAEAGRLWGERRYRALSSLVAERILREETALVPGLGRTLLPGAQGFSPEQGRWRLNPSYAPPFLMTWFATHSGDPRWEEVRRSAHRMLVESAPLGLAPDWAYYAADAGDPATTSAASGKFALKSLPPEQRVGGYDAIRVYLWLGLTHAADPGRAALLQHFSPLAQAIEAAGAPPRAWDAGSAELGGPAGSPGFAAAVLPFLAGLERTDAAHKMLTRLQSNPPSNDAYYDQALSLFGRGGYEGRFSFAADGSLVLPAGPCEPGAAKP